jgi:oxygen-independent coproporphyrinogen-3 oxidase
MTLGLYLHIPWCPTRCIYCDFNTYVDDQPDLKIRYHRALLREIREAGAALGRPALNTIFFGGGTPTTLQPAQLVELVEAVKISFDLHPAAEITTEANPGTLSLDYLRDIRLGGINRLSLGVQSFNNDELAFLSRLHNADTARQAVNLARRAGFENISLDLIFNLPQQTPAQWEVNLREALQLAPDHFSIYSLIVEPGTPLYRQVAQGITPAPDDDVAADMYAATIDALGEAGYLHYEISNWARGQGEREWETPALASAHNLIYWRNQPYLGLGAGAFGTVNGQRWANVKRPQQYIALVEDGGGLGAARDERTAETIEPDMAMGEHMMLGLRLLREGIGAADFLGRFGVALAEKYSETIAINLDRGWLVWVNSPTGPRLRLTPSGRFLANQVVLDFI